MSLSSSSTILEGFQEERDIIASIYFDSFQSSEKNDGYLVTINPYADDCNDSLLPRSRFPLSVTVKVSPRLLLQSASAFEYPHVGAPLPWFSPQRAGLMGLSSMELGEATSFLNKTARSLVDQGHVVFETLSRFSEWLRELPPCFFGESVLPDELILRIFSFLTPTELLKASLVSKTWRKIALDKYFWASFLINSRAIDPIAYKFSCLQQRCSSVARKPVRFYMASLKQAGSLRTQAVEMATIKPSSAMEVTAFDGGGGPLGQIVAFAATTSTNVCTLNLATVAGKLGKTEIDNPIDDLQWHGQGRVIAGFCEGNQMVQLWQHCPSPSLASAPSLSSSSSDINSSSSASQLHSSTAFVNVATAFRLGETLLFTSGGQVGATLHATDFEHHCDISGDPLISPDPDCSDHISVIRTFNADRCLAALSASRVQVLDLRSPRIATHIPHGATNPRSLVVETSQSFLMVSSFEAEFKVFDLRILSRPLFKVVPEDSAFEGHVSDIDLFNTSPVGLAVKFRPALQSYATVNIYDVQRPFSCKQFWNFGLTLPLNFRRSHRPYMKAGPDYLLFSGTGLGNPLLMITPDRPTHQKLTF